MSEHLFTMLLLRLPESLSMEEKESIKAFYTINGRIYVEKIAIQNKIIPFAAHVFMHIHCDSDYWKAKHDFWQKRNRIIKEMLEKLFLAFNRNNVKSTCLVENFATVLRSDACIGCFCSGDVDISADLNERIQIAKSLEELNFSMDKRIDQSITNSNQVSTFYNDDLIADGFRINVMWQPIARSFLVQEDYDVRFSKERLKATTIMESNIRVLNATALMYYNILHIALGHYYTLSPGMRLYVDIDRLARTNEVNWGELLKWTIEDHSRIRTAIVLHLSFEILKTPIPKGLFQKMYRNKRCMNMISYLYDKDQNKLQNKGDRFHRLFVELNSNDCNIVLGLFQMISGATKVQTVSTIKKES